ncbi:MAG: glycosyltransferase [Christensenella sp.]|nr:glycosyltransferase [Christensenella sp.]
MKILQINSVCSGSTGRIAAGVSRVLREQGHESLLLYGRGGPAEGIASERIESQLGFFTHVAYARLSDRQGFASSAATRRMARLIEAYAPDVIQLHNLHGYYLDQSILLPFLAGYGKPVVWTLHDCNAFTGHCAHFDAYGCMRWREKCHDCQLKKEYPKSILLDQSARNFAEKKELTSQLAQLTIVTPSNWLAKLANQSFLGDRETVTIHNGIDPSVFQPTQSDLRARYGIDANQRLVLGVSNYWEPRKGLSTLVDLAERLSGDSTVALVGLSPQQLKSLPKGVIGVQRTANAAELAAWYSAADVFVNPTVEDTFPTTQIEALACGTPVICYDVGGCAESLDDSCGAAVPKGDFPALADAVLRSGTFKRENCLRRAKMFDQQDRYRDYAALYARLNGGDNL